MWGQGQRLGENLFVFVSIGWKQKEGKFFSYLWTER